MAQISFRVDDELKLKTEKIYESLGMNMTTAFTMFMKATVRKNGIPFPTDINESDTKQEMERLKKTLLSAEQNRLAGDKGYSTDEVRNMLNARRSINAS